MSVIRSTIAVFALAAAPLGGLAMSQFPRANPHVPKEQVGLEGATFWSCKFAETANPLVDTCEGFRKDFSLDQKSSRDMTRWLKKRDLHGKARSFPRQSEGGGTVDRTIDAITGPANYQLRDLGARVLVVATLSGDPGSQFADRYHIGQPYTSKNWQRQFYFVVDSFVAPTTDQPIKYNVARWRLLGINPSGNLVEVSTGRVQYCAHRHDKDLRKLASYFTTCEGAEKLSKSTEGDPVIRKLGGLDVVLEKLRAEDSSRNARERVERVALANRVVFSPVVSAALKEFLENTEVDPAWLVCGLGCCSLEF